VIARGKREKRRKKKERGKKKPNQGAIRVSCDLSCNVCTSHAARPRKGLVCSQETYLGAGSGTSYKEKQIGTKKKIMSNGNAQEQVASKRRIPSTESMCDVYISRPKDANRQVGTESLLSLSLFYVVMNLRSIKNYSLCGLFR
jgi:hypothetical protein